MRCSLIGSFVLVLSSCGTFIPDVPRPAARTSSPALVTEQFAVDSVPFGLPVTDAAHAAWFSEGQVHWLTATSRGVVKVPTALWPRGTSRSAVFDAIDGAAWAYTHDFEARKQELHALGAEGARELPLPWALSDGAVLTIRAWDASTLLVLVLEEGETQLCRWRDEQWACAKLATSRPGFELTREGDALVLQEYQSDGATRWWSYLVEAGTLEPRTEAPVDDTLKPGALLEHEGQPTVELRWTISDYALDCYDTDLNGIRTICAKRGSVTELVLFDQGGAELAWAHVEGHPNVVRRYGSRLLATDSLSLTLVELP